MQNNAPENWEVVLSGLSTSSSVYSISNTQAHKHQERNVRGWKEIEEPEMFSLSSQQVKIN